MSTSENQRGVIALIGSSFLFAFMAALIRFASDEFGLDVFKMGVFRFAIGMAVLGLAAMFHKIELRFVASWPLLIRGLFGGASVVCLYISLTKIGVARGMVLSYSYPVFATIASVILLRESVGLIRWLAVFAAIGGIALIASDKVDSAAGEEIAWWWYGIALLGALFSGIAVTYVRKLSATDTPYAIFFSQCLLGFWLTVVPANLKPVELSLPGGGLLVAIGVTAAIAQLLMTYAYGHITISTGSVLSMLSPVLTAIIGFAVFSEQLSSRSLIGMAVVIASCTAVVVLRSRSKAAAPEESSTK